MRRIPVLLYHKIDKNLFAKQMSYLAKKRYRTFSLNEFVKSKFQEKSIILTFDDGFEDNYLYIYPILEKYNFKATFFLTTDLVGTSPFISWNQVREMSARGMFFEAHTCTHANLVNLTFAEAKYEIRNSKKVIEDKIGKPVNFFSYPYSKFNDTIREIVKENGYQAACSTFQGIFRLNSDMFAIPRLETSIHPHILDILEFKIKTSGWYII